MNTPWTASNGMSSVNLVVMLLVDALPRIRSMALQRASYMIEMAFGSQPAFVILFVNVLLVSS